MNFSYIAYRNGVPCELFSLNEPQLPRIRKVLIPSALPPKPQRFHQMTWAENAIARTERASRLLRESIIAEWLLKKHPELEWLMVEAKYTLKMERKS